MPQDKFDPLVTISLELIADSALRADDAHKLSALAAKAARTNDRSDLLYLAARAGEAAMAVANYNYRLRRLRNAAFIRAEKK
jgi:hypothetical protein